MRAKGRGFVGNSVEKVDLQERVKTSFQFIVPA
jgi:hypothetical protein